MKRSTKIALGVATVYPIVYIFLFMAVIFSLVLLSSGGPPPAGFEQFAGPVFILIFALHMLTIFLALGLTVFYLVHVIKDANAKPEIKAVWAVLFFFAGMFAQPVYWYLYIWKDGASGAPPGQLPPPDASAWATPGETRTGEYAPPAGPPDWR